jgi:hypothetical protein
MALHAGNPHLAALDALKTRLSPAAAAEARRLAYALSFPGETWGDGMTPDEAWRAYGAEVLAAHPELLQHEAEPLAPAGVTYFASGSTHAPTLRALVLAGQCVGVSLSELTRETLREVRWLASVPGRVRGLFVDSGAFSEEGPSRMPDTAWAERVGRGEGATYGYLEIVDALTWPEYRSTGSVWRLACPVYLVAPDCVGDQAETLRRLRLHREAVLALAARGARVVVPVQRGALSLAEFWAAELELLGPGAWVVGVPCNRSATNPDEFRRFMAQATPAAVHLLGLGPTRASFGAFLRAAGGAEVSCDSGLKRRLEGTTNGAGHGPRAIALHRGRLAQLGEEARAQAAVLAGVLDETRRGPQMTLPLGGAVNA